MSITKHFFLYATLIFYPFISYADTVGTTNDRTNCPYSTKPKFSGVSSPIADKTAKNAEI